MRWIYGLVAVCFMMLAAGCGNLSRPMDFHFDTQNNVAQNATITSNTITIQGNQFAADITIVNGTYSISGGAYTSAAGKIGLNQTLTIQQTSAATTNTATVTTVTVGGYTTTFTSVTNSELSFQAQTGVELSSTITSNTLTIPSTWSSSAISIVGGNYSIDGGAYTNADGTIGPGQTLAVQHTSSASNSTTTTTTVTVGSHTITFTSTTKGVTLPSFSAVVDAELNTLVESAPITYPSTLTAATVSILNGLFAISTDTSGTAWGSFTNGTDTANNTIQPGRLLKVNQTTANSYLGQTVTTVTIGGSSTTFITTTKIGGTTDATGTIKFLSFHPSTTLFDATTTSLSLYANLQNSGSASAAATVTWQAKDSSNAVIANGSFTTASIAPNGGTVTYTSTGTSLLTSQYLKIASWTVSVVKN
ncbi:hypothetical protein F6V30_02480 [Oryzomonas sagensis]|uniref:Uncharacterized protein n=1 Tax=Oryzomonas sagensis TaxID=2603857 RepID=A0ABQ6TR42_9BACT|nr:hypothetical protein [Oryzomonas sagensis]KAB0671465.1 hypothetical protein F6V30_02480 [Oryzomonas sagensis]